MKKNNLLLALLASSLILASCGDDKNNSESGKENETSQQSDDSNGASGEPGLTSEPEISVDTRTNEQKVKDLFNLMAEGKSSTIEYSGYITEFYGEDKGMWNEVPASDTDSESSGIAVIPNYGIYSVAFDSDSQEYYFASILTPNTQLNLGDVQYTTTDLGKAAKTVTFTESSRTHTFSTDDATFCSTMLAVLGGASAANIYATKKVSFNINDDGSALTNMSLELKGSTDTKNYPNQTMEGLKISKIGSTFDLDFELLITNPDISTKTGWSQYETSFFTTYIHQQFTLPFPTGASYAINEDVLEDDGSISFYFEDLGCGNLVNSYKNQLAAAGFTQNDDQTDLTKGIYCYEKTLVAATTNAGAIKEYALFTWQNDSSAAVYYPNGKFIIIAYARQEVLKMTVAELTTTLSSHTLSDGTQYWPSINYGNCTGASLDDQTDYMAAQYPEYPAEFYGIIKLYYATEAEAIAAVSTITGKLTKAGYSYDDTYEKYYLSVGDYYEGEEVDVSVIVAYDDNGNYLGYVLIIIDSYSYDNSWYY